MHNRHNNNNNKINIHQSGIRRKEWPICHMRLRWAILIINWIYQIRLNKVLFFQRRIFTHTKSHSRHIFNMRYRIIIFLIMHNHNPEIILKQISKIKFHNGKMFNFIKIKIKTKVSAKNNKSSKSHRFLLNNIFSRIQARILTRPNIVVAFSCCETTSLQPIVRQGPKLNNNRRKNQ